MSRVDGHFRLRIPDDIKSWVKAQADHNERSITAEIIFILKQRMREAKSEKSGTSV